MFSLPPELYLPIYQHSMLALVILTALVYGQGSSKGSFSIGFSALMIWATGFGIILFLGTRPINGVFIDMTTYAVAFEMAQNTGRDLYPDWGFNLLADFCGKVTNAEVFFAICMMLYVVPIAIGMRRVHREWAYAAFLAFAGGFSFYSYGVNGIRNGLSTSLLVAAFAFWDRKLIMVLLMIAAESMHKSALLPIAAFISAGIYAQPWLYGLAWTGALGLSMVMGERLSNFFVNFTGSVGDDERLSVYANNAGFGADKGGFRPDFVLYSIVPVIMSYAMASPLTRKDPFYRRLVCTYLLANAFWLLVMYAAFSNRFAYLSWFMMPWVVIYPFMPKSEEGLARGAPREEPRLGLLGAALIAHYAFTYIMGVFVYPNRGG